MCAKFQPDRPIVKDLTDSRQKSVPLSRLMSGTVSLFSLGLGPELRRNFEGFWAISISKKLDDQFQFRLSSVPLNGYTFVIVS